MRFFCLLALPLLLHFSSFGQYRTAPEKEVDNYQRTKASDIHVKDEVSETEYSDRVDPFIGTAEHGHTFPGATTPFGMVQISPDNGVKGWDWYSGYHWSSSEIEFFSHKHLSGTGGPDLGDIAMMPFTGKYEREYSFNHENEYARPGYYAVRLDNGILCEFTATPRCAVHRYTFPEGMEKNLKVNLNHSVFIDLNKRTYFKWMSDTTFGGLKKTLGWALSQRCFFAARTSEPFKKQSGAGKATLKFEGGSQVLEIRVGLSTVSVENAQKNLDEEVANKSFDEVRAEAEQLWETELSKIDIEASPETKTVFYTGMYHLMIAPSLLSDVNGEFRNPNGKLEKAEGYHRYSTFSLWDTYRAAHSLFILLKPDVVDDFVRSMLSHYDYRGKLPIWELEANETYCMIGNHSIPVISEAWRKGIRNFDEKKALTACITTADQHTRGLKHYMKKGYVNYGEDESVSKTLEYAYNDWAVAKFAESLGNTDVASRYLARADNYKNLFDTSTGLMRPKDRNGKWLKNFDQFSHKKGLKRHYTEGNAWQYSWSVQHDPEGLVALYGSPKAFETQLDKLFVIDHDLPSTAKLLDVTGLIGQYAHGNEPSHHTVYLYNYSEHPWKGQEMLRRICREFYTEKPDGLCGNEDCGQMSAWYIFSALGFYPLDPVGGQYELGSPLVDKAVMKLANGKTFTVLAENQSPENVYVQKVEWNGQPIDLKISHEQMMEGGELKFTMGSEPKK
ncbi:MAG: glycoside hydrolase family 92 protein [Flavobacteriales bacterium]|nr:glycoside hydrolase family 92 protein [Flavobacteriales bacterium]